MSRQGDKTAGQEGWLSPSPRSRRLSGLVVSLIATLPLACGLDRGPIEPPVAAICDLAAPTDLGAAELLPAGANCLSLSAASARYALAYFDARFVEGARTAHEAFSPDAGDFTVTVGSAESDRVIEATRTARGRAGDEPRFLKDDWVRLIPTAASREHEDDDLPSSENGEEAPSGDRALPSTSCDVDPELELFCQDRPWREGDLLDLPGPFGLLIHDMPRSAEILVVRGPFAFAVRKDLGEDARAQLGPILARLALVGQVRVLPFLRRALIDREVFTSAGSGQILVDVSLDQNAVCVCGVAVGMYAQGASVSGISIRIPAGPEFEAHRIGLFAHELTHVWQHAFDTQRVPDPTVAIAPSTRWAVEGGADFVRQEILRGLAAEPLDGNRDTSTRFANPFLDRWIRELDAASGRIRNGYGQTAGMLRHLFVRTLDDKAGYDDALQSILQGSLEGWFGSPDGSAAGVGLARRLQSVQPEFEPARALLEYAISNAVDDRIEAEDLQNPAVLEAWRESPGSRFVPAALIGSTGPRVKLGQPAGSLGYVYVDHAGGSRVLGLGADIEGVRWMVVRFE